MSSCVFFRRRLNVNESRGGERGLECCTDGFSGREDRARDIEMQKEEEINTRLETLHRQWTMRKMHRKLLQRNERRRKKKRKRTCKSSRGSFIIKITQERENDKKQESTFVTAGAMAKESEKCN